MQHYKYYTDGKWLDAQSEETYEVFNPCTEDALATVPKCDKHDAQIAINAARHAFDSGVWSNITPKQRSQIMIDMLEKLRANQDELADLESKNGGAPIREAMFCNVAGFLEYFGYYADLAGSISYYESLPSTPWPAYNYVNREPIGVCGLIVPWNYPLIALAWKLAPAIAAGNTVVLKPASYTPLTALKFCEIIEKSDIPPGVVNVITGPGHTVGEEIASNEKVDMVAFTGSTVVGRRLMELASQTVKKIALELGGKSPAIILDDVNTDLAVGGIVWGGLLHAGQACAAGTRLLLPESIHDEFVDKLVERISCIKLGDTADYSTDMGPLVSADQRAIVEGYIKLGLDQGAKLACGGSRPKGIEKGYFVEPTIFTDVNNNMRIAQEEIFGPVLSVIKYTSIDEAIAIANDTIYGLAASVWSEDMSKAQEIALKIKAGTVWINEHSISYPPYPFGGYKQSGIGREGGEGGLYEYTESKHVYVDLVRKSENKPWYSIICSG